MRHLVNAYEVEAGTVKFAGNTVGNTWALLRWCSTKRRYIRCTYLYLYLYLYCLYVQDVLVQSWN